MLFSNITKSYSDCYGCGLCTLVCPVWHQSHNVCCTPHGHAKALQSRGEINIIGLFDCILCGACEPVCPENISLMQMILELRQNATKNKTALNDNPVSTSSFNKEQSNQQAHNILLLADEALLERTNLLKQTLKLLNASKLRGIEQAQDSGCDISSALQSGLEITPLRLKEFLSTLKTAKKLIVSDCLLKRKLQQWLPNTKILSLGFVLSSLPALQYKLNSKDLYIIECKAYNADFERMVSHYNKLKQQSNCHLNLDLQRLAVPTGAGHIENRSDAASDMPRFNSNKQTQWILQGLNFERIVVECVKDGIAIAQVSDKPIFHLTELLSTE